MSKDAKVADYKEAVKFISDNMNVFSEKETKHAKTGEKVKTVVLTINKAEYDTFMKDRGINKDTLKTIVAANVEYNNAANIVVTDELIARKADRVVLRTRSGASRNDVGVTAKSSFPNPQTGERMTVIGSYNYKSFVRGVDESLVTTLRAKIKKHLGE